jgi:hypothetical protein
MQKDYLVGIIFCFPDGKDKEHIQVYKYHDIRNTPTKIDAFLRFAEGKPGAEYVNFYYKTDSKSEKGRNFAFRLYCHGFS